MRFELRGTIEELLTKAERMKEVTTYRKNQGWLLFKDDEEWRYEPQWDWRLCPVCETYGYNRDYRGNEIPNEFPERVVLQPTEVHPHIHQMREFWWLKGDCRCRLFWVDHMFTLTNRLFLELEAV